jgi:hypothetical protein
MARPERQRLPRDVPLDPTAYDRAYRRAKARRLARIERRREHRRANRRFWITLLVLVVGLVALGLADWHEVQQLFGL